MRSKAYRATAVNRIDAGQVTQGHAGQSLTVGLGIGKYRVLAVARRACMGLLVNSAKSA